MFADKPIAERLVSPGEQPAPATIKWRQIPEDAEPSDFAPQVETSG
jgi:hypothetical protein